MSTVGDVRRVLGVENECGLPDAVAIGGASTLDAPMPGTLVFAKRVDDRARETIANHPSTLFLVPRDSVSVLSAVGNHLFVNNPRLAFGTVVDQLFLPRKRPSIASTATVEDGATIGSEVHIGHGAVVEAGAEIGDCVTIGHNSVILGRVKIGSGSVVGANTTIGGVGFGLEFDVDGLPFRIPHVGGVRIGCKVEIGNNCSIARGTIGDTVLEDYVKLDDQVFVAHNALIKEAAFLIAGSLTSGSVIVGRRAWVAPGAVITNGVKLGDDVMLGLGAVVVSNIPERSLAVGLPAKVRGANPRLPRLDIDEMESDV